MAAGDINVVINSETKAFRQGVQSGVIEPLDDAQKALDDLGKSRGPEQLESDMKAAQKATEQLGDSTEREAKRIEQQFRDTYRSSGSAASDFAGDADSVSKRLGASSEEVGGELRQNIGETFSSFRGDVTDFGQIAQDTLGGLATSLEGVPGLAAAAGGAAGIGLIIAALTAAQQRAQAVATATGDITSQIIQDGAAAQLDQLQSQLTDIFSGKFTQVNGTSRSLKQIQQDADAVGVSVETMARAWAGSTSDIDAVNKRIKDQTASLKAVRDETRLTGSGTDLAAIKYGDYQKATEKVTKALGEQVSAQQNAQKAADEWEDAQGRALQATQEQLSQYSDALGTAASDTDDFYDKTTGKFDTAGYIKQWTDLANQIKTAAADIATSDLSDAAKQYLAQQAPQAQAEFISAYKAANPTQQAALAQIWSDMGTGNASSYAQSLISGLPKTVTGPTVSLVPDTAAWDAALKQVQKTSVRIPAQFIVSSSRGGPVD